MNNVRKWLIVAIAVITLVAIGYFALTRTLDHLVRDGTLTRLIGKKTAVKLEVDAGYLPLGWRGMSIRSDGLLVRGKPPRSLTVLQAANLRAYCSLQNLWQRKWTITRLQASRLQAHLVPAAATHWKRFFPRAKSQPQIETSSPAQTRYSRNLCPTQIYFGEKLRMRLAI